MNIGSSHVLASILFAAGSAIALDSAALAATGANAALFDARGGSGHPASHAHAAAHAFPNRARTTGGLGSVRANLADSDLGEQPIGAHAIATGEFASADADLVVMVPGLDLSLGRSYSSDVARVSNGLLGEGWHASMFRFAAQEVGGSTADLHIVDTRHADVGFVWNATDSQWQPTGPSDAFIDEATVVVGANTYATWRLRIPGAVDTHFYRPHAGGGGITATPATHEGLIALVEDVYGNEHRYAYTVYGTNLASNLHAARLDTIQAWPSGASAAVAEVEFRWIDDDSLDNAGKLEEVREHRWDDATPTANKVEMRRVAYTYKADGDSLPDDLGTEGDLIQVARYTRLDTSTSSLDTWRQEVTQYRYHGGVTNETSSDTDSDGFIEQGSAHQLKMVFLPEQIEHFTQAFSGHDASVDTLAEGGAELLALDDSDIWFTGRTEIAADVAAKVIAQYETSGDKRIKEQYLLAGCGCSGTGFGEMLAYDYFAYGAAGYGDVSATTKVETYSHDGSAWNTLEKTEYFDTTVLAAGWAPMLLTQSVVDGSDKWVSHSVLDGSEGTATRLVMPSAVTAYTPGTVSTAPSITVSTSAGLAYGFAYASGTPFISQQRVANGNKATLGDFTLVEGMEHTNSGRPWLMTASKRYRVEGSTAADNVEETGLAYGFHSGDAIAWIKTSVEAELESENGPSGSGNLYDSYALFDANGEMAWNRDADGMLAYTQRDARTGAVTSMTRNEPGATLGSSWGGGLSTTGWGLSGDQITNSYELDLLGRTVSASMNEGSAFETTSYTIRTMKALPQLAGISYYAEVNLPHVLMSGGSPTGEYDGPARVSWMHAGGGMLRGSSYEPDADGSGDYDLSDPDANLSTELSRSVVWRHLSGAVESQQVWWDIANGKSMETTFGYDALGRKEWTRTPAGTYTRSTYDARDRVIKQEVGTVLSGGSTDMVTTAEYFYDHEEVMGSPVQGVGDGRLTMVRRHASASEVRDTETIYDYRGRAIKTINPLAPHSYTVYDNLSRPVETAVFSSEPSGIATPLADRGSYSKTNYSQRGMVYRTQSAIDPTSGSPTHVENHSWFDDDGRVIASWGPNGPAQKVEYDSLGRMTKTWTTDRGGDAAPGASGNYADATSLSGDIVVEQSETQYITDTNLADLSTHRVRAHDVAAGQTGDLTGLSSASTKSIATFNGMYYDDAGRPIRSVAFGTTQSTFKGGGTAPTITQASPPDDTTSPTTQLVSATTYNNRGQVDISINPEGDETRFLYDDMGRQYATIENYVNASVVWSTTPTPDRWVASNLNDDADRVTSTVYDDYGRAQYRVAHMPDGSGDSVQITEYVYGTSAVSGSLLVSNDILTRVKYPDETTGAAGGSSIYWVDTTYNRLGEPLTVKDQAGTTHAYTRDALGRVTEDEATAFGTNIDQTIDSITFEYDDLGRRWRVRSYDSTTIINAVEFEYTVRGEVAKVWQDHDSDVDKVGGGSNSRVVEYDYAAADVSSGNFVRMSTLTYPDGAELDYTYAGGGGLDDDMSRVSGLELDSTSVVEYDRIGMSMDARVRYPEPMVRLDRWVKHNGDRIKGDYAGYDRFGRVAKQTWVDDAYSSHVFSTTLPNRTPIVELEYAYDRLGNPLSRYDARPGAQADSRDEQYDYDGLRRLKDAERGSWNGSSFTLQNGSDTYDRDAIGNWNFSGLDSDSDGVFTDPGEKTDRTNNMANEVTLLDIVQGAFDPMDIGVPPTTYVDVPLDITWDHAGNMRTRDEHFGGGLTAEHVYTHDAWNRLVKVVVGVYDRAEYEYNGLGWRIRARSDDPEYTDGTYDEERVMAYDASWRMLEELIDDDLDVSAGFDRSAQQVWGLRYIDDAVVRRTNDDLTDDGSGVTYDDWYYYCTDVNFSPLAVLDDTALLVNRVRYRPYGLARHQYPGDLNEDGTVSSGEVTAITGAGTIAITSGSYDPNMDIDRNGLVDGTNDGALVSMEYALPEGWVKEERQMSVAHRGRLQLAVVQLAAARNLLIDQAHDVSLSLTRVMDHNQAGELSSHRGAMLDVSCGVSRASGVQGRNIISPCTDRYDACVAGTITTFNECILIFPDNPFWGTYCLNSRYDNVIACQDDWFRCSLESLSPIDDPPFHVLPPRRRIVAPPPRRRWWWW
jgi:YD repeat-containing protein